MINIFGTRLELHVYHAVFASVPTRIGLLPDTFNCGLRMRRECRERFLAPGLAISTFITSCAWRTCRDACRGRQLIVSFEAGGEENVPSIPGACATRNFTYLVRNPSTRITFSRWQMTIKSDVTIAISDRSLLPNSASIYSQWLSGNHPNMFLTFYID